VREITPTRARSRTRTPESVRGGARRPASYVFACTWSNNSNTVRFFRETYRLPPAFLLLWPYELRSGSRSLSSGPVVVQSRVLDITITIEILRRLSREALGPRVSFALGQWATAHVCYIFVPTTLDQLVLAFRVRCKTF
jgi:hypothetical protein